MSSWWRFWEKRDSLDGYAPDPPQTIDPWSEPAVLKQVDAFERAEAERRMDGYSNPLTGIGDFNRDKIFGGSRFGIGFSVSLLSSLDAEARWRGSDLGARIIETIPDEMTREGWELNVQPSEDDRVDAATPGVLPALDDSCAQLAEEVDGILDELDATRAISSALRYERAYGGGALLIDADDGREPWEPLHEESLTKINALIPFSGGWDSECIAYSWYPPGHPQYGQPEVYMVRALGAPNGQVPIPGAVSQPVRPLAPTVIFVHESRLLLFRGEAASRRARFEMRGWGDSIFTRLDEVLSQYSQTWGGVANLMSDFSQAVLKVSGLAVAMSGGDKSGRGNPIQARARTIQLGRSLARMVVIDAEEEFTRETASLAGISDILQQFALRLAAAADMPVDLLFSSMNGGALNKGDSTVRFFYDRIAAKQKRQLLPQLKKLYRLIFLSSAGPTSGVEPERWSVKFRPLTQLTELEQAQLRKTQSETDVAYINAGVISPEEVAASRFGGSSYSTDTVIDFEGRAALASIDTPKQPALPPRSTDQPSEEPNNAPNNAEANHPNQEGQQP